MIICERITGNVTLVEGGWVTVSEESRLCLCDSQLGESKQRRQLNLPPTSTTGTEQKAGSGANITDTHIYIQM